MKQEQEDIAIRDTVGKISCETLLYVNNILGIFFGLRISHLNRQSLL